MDYENIVHLSLNKNNKDFKKNYFNREWIKAQSQSYTFEEFIFGCKREAQKLIDEHNDLFNRSKL